MENTPAVSVIIPMYNVEKYIAETLDSLLMQTFQDFEVIVVNDCSTDNSRAIAESYIEKFGGRLTIFDNEKNSGAGATRNNGLRSATGEYVFFMDADDLLLLNGLEEMCTFVKDYDVDFINCTANYRMSADGKKSILKRGASKVVPVIMLETNMNRVIDIILRRKTSYAPWRKLCKRNFLIENELFFPENIRVHEDKIWTYGMFLCAKKILQIPKPYVFYRRNETSLSQSEKTEMKHVLLSITPLIYGMKWIDNILNRLEFFKQNPQKRFEVLESLVVMFFDINFKYRVKLETYDIYEAVKQEFAEALGDNDILIAQFIAYMDTLSKRVAELENQLKTNLGENSYDNYYTPPHSN